MDDYAQHFNGEIPGPERTVFVGMFLCGSSGLNLRPTVVVSCEDAEVLSELKRKLGTGWATSQYPWLKYRFSTDFPHEQPSHRAGIGTDEIDSEHQSIESEDSSTLSDADTDSDDTSNKSNSLLVRWNVYVRGPIESGQISFPTIVYIGISLGALRKATIGGLVQLEGDSRLYGITVAHMLKMPGSDVHDLRSSSGTKQTTDSNTISDYEIVGTVVRSTRELPSSKLDWALVQFSEKYQVIPSSRYKVLKVPDQMFDFSRDLSTWHPEVCIMRPARRICGWLGPYPYYIHCPGDRFFVKTLPVKLYYGESIGKSQTLNCLLSRLT